MFFVLIGSSIRSSLLIFLLSIRMIVFLLFSFSFSSSSRIIVSGIPLHARFDDIEPLLKPYGKVEHCDAVSSKDPNTQTVHITYETVEQAQRYFAVSFEPAKFLQNKKPKKKKIVTTNTNSLLLGIYLFWHLRTQILSIDKLLN